MNGGKNLETSFQKNSNQDHEWAAISDYVSSFAENNEGLIEYEYGSVDSVKTMEGNSMQMSMDEIIQSDEEVPAEILQENIEIMQREIDNLLNDLNEIRLSRTSLQRRLNNLSI